MTLHPPWQSARRLAASGSARGSGCRSAKGRERRHQGITLIEALIVLVVICVVGVLVLQRVVRVQRPAGGLNCINNLKIIGLSFRLYATDNADRFPLEVSTNQGGTREWGGAPWRHFQILSNELATPRTLICGWDTRLPATNFASLSDSNVSYFVSLSAREIEPTEWLAGDRHLATNGHPLLPGLVTVTPGSTFHWTRLLHSISLTDLPRGNVGLSDGSALAPSSASLIANRRDGSLRVTGPLAIP